MLRKLFGKSSETLDPAQLEMLLGEPPGPPSTSSPNGGAPEEASASSAVRAEAKPRSERIPDHLPGVEEVLLPEPVKACPDAWRRIGEEKSDSLDSSPARSSSRRHGHEPGAYLKDVLERLTGIKSGELDALQPSKWQPAGQAGIQEPAAGRT